MALSKLAVLQLRAQGFREAQKNATALARLLVASAKAAQSLGVQARQAAHAFTLVAGTATGASAAMRTAFSNVDRAASRAANAISGAYARMLTSAQAAAVGASAAIGTEFTTVGKQAQGVAGAAAGAFRALGNAVSDVGARLPKTPLDRVRAAAEATRRTVGGIFSTGAITVFGERATTMFAKVQAAGATITEGLVGGLQRAGFAIAGFGAAAFGAFKLLERGEKTQNVAAGFERLSQSIGGSQATLERLNRATGGGVANSELMVAANRLLAAQLGVTGDRMEKLFATGTRLGRALGFTASEAVQRLSLALAKQEPELLDELGIKVDLTKAIQAYAEANGVTVESLDAQTRARIFLNAVEKQAEERSAALGQGVGTVAGASEILQKRWTDLTDRFTVMLAQQPGIFEGLKAIGEAVFGLAQALTPVIKLVAGLVAELAKLGPLLPALTGAAVGFAVGGPVGALVGGGVGLVGGLLGETGPSRAPGTAGVSAMRESEMADQLGYERARAVAAGRVDAVMDGVARGVERGVRRGIDDQFANVFVG